MVLRRPKCGIEISGDQLEIIDAVAGRATAKRHVIDGKKLAHRDAVQTRERCVVEAR
jgi:hypothetical protein